MADRGWTSRVATAAGVAAGTGAAQLGLGYGLGVIVWPVAVTQDRSEWLGSLGWATWITASATVFGAVVASRLGGERSGWSGSARRGLLAISAGVGALVAVALIALPARSAVRLDAHSPQAIAAGYALIGVVLGVLVAYWAVSSRPVAANLVATAAWLWALAITAIIVELSTNRDSATYLTSWQFAGATDGVRYGVIYWPSAVLTLAAAFLVGVIAVIPAVRRGDLGLGAATSGAVGPLLVAASFLALSPRLTDSMGPIESAYLIAPYAVLAGLAGSALTVTAGKSLARSPEDAQPADASPHPDSASTATASASASASADDHSADDAEPAATPLGKPSRAPWSRRRAKLPAPPSPDESAADVVATPKPARPQSAQPRSGQSQSDRSQSDRSQSDRSQSAQSPLGESQLGESQSAQPPSGQSRSGQSPSDRSQSGPSRQAGPTPTGTSSARPVPTPRPASGAKPDPIATSSTTRTPNPLTNPPRAPEPITSPPQAPGPAAAHSSAARAAENPGAAPASSRAGAEPAADSENADPEIAAAARSGRLRGRKATPAPKTPAEPASAEPASAPAKSTDTPPAKSTVTPPPADPTIARINPKPTADG